MTGTAPTLSPLVAPAQYLGIQPGFAGQSDIELYVLISPVGHHPVGSTVSRQTLEKHGFNLLTNRDAPGKPAASDQAQS